MGNPANLKPFVKGDSRINRAGRPRTFDALRTLSVSLAHEIATDKDGKTIVIAGHKVTVVEVVLRQWITSGDFQKQNRFLEICFGKVSDRVEVKAAVSVSAIDWSALSDDDLHSLIAMGEKVG